jgi:hypothetical protein
LNEPILGSVSATQALGPVCVSSGGPEDAFRTFADAHTKGAGQLQRKSTGEVAIAASRNLEAAEHMGDGMNSVRIAAVVLIVAGILGLAYGGFTYTKETHSSKVGPIELSFKDRERVNVPAWAGVGAIAIGGVLLVARRKA